MLDLKLIQNDPEAVKLNLNKRHFDSSIIDEVLKLNERRKELIALVESKRAETKKLSKEVGMLKREGKDASELMAQVTEIKNNIEASDKELINQTKQGVQLSALLSPEYVPN